MPTVTEHPPVKPTTKHEFKTPLDMLEHVAPLKGIKLPFVPPKHLDPKLLLGTWFNADSATPGILKVDITSSPAGLFIHLFGACTPTPCDWGTVPAKMFADSVCTTDAVAFTGEYKFNFKETLVTARLEFGALILETFNHFIDGSGRSDYNSFSVMYKHVN